MSDMAPEQGQAEQGPVDSGQAVDAPVSDGQGVEDSPFFEYEHDDGEVMKFGSPDELKSHFRDGLLRHSDYTKKTQELAEQRKKFDSERQRWEAERTANLQAYSKWSKIDDRFRKDPKFRQALTNAMRQDQQQGGNSNVDALLQQRLGPIQQKIQQWERQQQEEQRKRQDQEETEKAFSLLEKNYEDFDRQAVQNEIQRLQQLPPGDSTRALYELLHLAMKGRVTPAQMEKQIAQRQRRNSTVKPPMSTSNASGKKQRDFTNAREAAEAAMRDMGIQ